MSIKSFIFISFILLPFMNIAQAPITFTATNAQISDTLTSGGVIKAACIHASDTIRAADDIIALQNVNVAGNINLAGSLVFEQTNTIGFKYFAPNTINNQFPLISFGKAANQPLPHAPICPLPYGLNSPWITVNGGFMSHYSAGLINAGLKFYTAGWNGWGHIELEGTNEVGQDNNALAINYFCGRETHINTNNALANEGGWVRMGGKVSMQKHLEIGDPQYGITDANNEALTIHVNAGKGLVLKTYNGSVKVISINNTLFPGISPFTVYGSGRTVIGYSVVVGTHADAMLQVAGKAASKSFYVLKPTTWQDRVFSSDYKLDDLKSVEAYYKKHNHLPGIASEKEILEEGYDVNEMDAKLLEKIENLYIYLVKQEKEIEQLKNELKKQQK